MDYQLGYRETFGMQHRFSYHHRRGTTNGFEGSNCNIQAEDSDDYDDLMSFRSSSGMMPSGSAADGNYNSFKQLAAFDSQASQIRK